MPQGHVNRSAMHISRGLYAAPGVDVYEIGDGLQVGNIMTAIWEAYEVARGL
jgi:hypothetical protein